MVFPEQLSLVNRTTTRTWVNHGHPVQEKDKLEVQAFPFGLSTPTIPDFIIAKVFEDRIRAP
jgi:hypothetical protein